MSEKYVIEYRKEDGSLDVKRVGSEPLNGEGTQRKIFNYYFSLFPEKDKVGWGEVIKYFKEQGLSIRRKYW